MTVREYRDSRPLFSRLAVVTLVSAIAGLVLSFSAMMALFLGAQGPGVDALLSLLAWTIPPAGALSALCLLGLDGDSGGRLAACWSRLPAWMVLLISVMMLIALLAELAIWLVEFSGGGTVAWSHYIPIVAVFVFALALTTGYALIAPPGEGGIHAGPVRHPDPVRREPPDDWPG